MQKASTWKTLPLEQVTSDALWELTQNYNCYLVKSQGATFSRDPLNLSGLNTKRDSGVANTRAIGIGFEAVDKKVTFKKAKKTAKVIRFSLKIKTHKALPKSRLVALPAKAVPLHNNTVYSDRRRVTLRSIAKTLQRDLTSYRRDLIPVAFKRLRKLNTFKKQNKFRNRAEDKKAKI
jgi:large subunit ribosomal protein L28e